MGRHRAQRVVMVLLVVFIGSFAIGLLASEPEELAQIPFLISFGALVAVVLVVLLAGMLPGGRWR